MTIATTKIRLVPESQSVVASARGFFTIAGNTFCIGACRLERSGQAAPGEAPVGSDSGRDFNGSVRRRSLFPALAAALVAPTCIRLRRIFLFSTYHRT